MGLWQSRMEQEQQHGVAGLPHRPSAGRNSLVSNVPSLYTSVGSKAIEPVNRSTGNLWL